MMTLFGVSIGGGVGWWLGNLLGMGYAVILSGIGSGLGLYLIRKVI